MQFRHFAIQQGKTHKDKEEMGTEDFERSFAQGQKRLNQHHAGEIFPRPVNHAGKGEKIQHAQRTDLPLVQGQAERLLRQMRAKPVMAHAQKEEANRPAHGKT